MLLKKPNGYWTRERCLEDAALYRTKADWRRYSLGAYSSAHKNGWMDFCCGHMVSSKRPNGFWTKDKCLSHALRYKTRLEWQSSHQASYKAAYKNRWLDDCCAHMDRPVSPRGFWTLDRCVESASRFQTRNGWRLGDHPAYKAARRRGWVDACCAHMVELVKPDGYWTLERCETEASAFETRSDWARGHPSSYSVAQRNGWLDECSSHMAEVIKKNGFWTKDACIADAARFKTRADWKLGSPSSYSKARKQGWVDEIADATGIPNYSGSSAQRAFADKCRQLLEGRNIELREEVYGLSGYKTKVDMAVYREDSPFLVIEYQGAYWHSEAAGKDRLYHRDRFQVLRGQGIRLLTVHERHADSPVVMGMIKSALGLIGGGLRASRCTVETVSDAVSTQFYNATHIQGGNIPGKQRLNIGLYHKGGIVACMTFVRSSDRHTGSGNYDWCLHRFSSSLEYRVHGAASRLLKRFRQMYPNDSIVSYCDLQYFDGRTYEAIGFKKVRENQPDYSWVKAQTVLAKHEAQRKFLPALLGHSFDETLSERQNMELAGWSKMWDCGKAVYAIVP